PFDLLNKKLVNLEIFEIYMIVAPAFLYRVLRSSLLLLLIVFFCFPAVAQRAPELHGSLPTLSRTKAYFRYFEDGIWNVDSAEVNLGQFRFRFSKGDDKLGILTIDNLPGTFSVYVSGITKIQVNENQFWKSKVVASNKSLEYVRINTPVEALQDSLMYLNKLKFSLSRDAELRLTDSLLIDAYTRQLYQYKFQFIEAHPSSEFSLFYLNDVWSLYSPEQLERILNRFSDSVKRHNLYEFLFRKLKKKQQLAVSKQITPSKFTLLDGKIFDIDSVSTPYLLINVWGTWCGPCVQELPQLRDLYNRYGSTSLTVLSIANEIKNTPKADFIKFIESHSLYWQHVLLYGSQVKHQTILNSLGINAYPTNILIHTKTKKIVLVADTKLFLKDVDDYLQKIDSIR
ncbi:MAG: AhpC/TSA family protein, partial [Bacteroidetes bacterium]